MPETAKDKDNGASSVTSATITLTNAAPTVALNGASDGFVSIGMHDRSQTGWFFIHVPEAKMVKNRVHLDVNVGGVAGTPVEERRPRVDAAVDRLVGEGATRLRILEEYGEYCVVMQDPEGNEFCLQ